MSVPEMIEELDTVSNSGTLSALAAYVEDSDFSYVEAVGPSGRVGLLFEATRAAEYADGASALERIEEIYGTSRWRPRAAMAMQAWSTAAPRSVSQGDVLKLLRARHLFAEAPIKKLFAYLGLALPAPSSCTWERRCPSTRAR